MNQFILRTLPLLLALTVPALAASNSSGGAAIYQANCAACHGAKEQGGIGPALNNEVSGKDLAAQWSYAVFSRALLKGLDDHGRAFKAPMPIFGKVGFASAPHKAPTPAQMKALQAYLKTLK
ncbi:hypothetical protein GCM10022631_09720 [Deinococcus rubellus]|uniref:c-type cytochrome n=1 Tax=Deinococcus rubellus TaxID=1889240 RepID=UPI0031EF0C54